MRRTITLLALSLLLTGCNFETASEGPNTIRKPAIEETRLGDGVGFGSKSRGLLRNTHHRSHWSRTGDDDPKLYWETHPVTNPEGPQNP